MDKFVLASGNKGKLKEFTEIFTPYGIEVFPQSQFNVIEVAETGTTFVENAIIKARHAAQVTGMAAIADDSGLEVDILAGAPGIYSARYAGQNAAETDNYIKLLNALKDNASGRTARFQCVLVYMRHAKDPTPIISQAAWEGHIGLEAKGENGHGYDPIFIPNDHTCTAAEINSDEKNRLSHRGKAMKMLIRQMQKQGILI
ncbi:RdgB/HAM1 family non-canonical purine NTP pyrophosphatase [Shewanella sp. VB17]|uniref:RdgB/HAM1 family non-canonical purine NTP pyrophosphatase n=1 Tax=Shewanella sp. VB17 TaxID=2739432 RepID=UPI0015675DFA|nr:RdgB/HAM1 family non-canonical purine NTP pyrophosphatase [Shewanella sp. VB17]NRD75009.1 RdgB/HAM1 family non-canonical purine NTP pyrophosphatase [Shewanella sp. VB17]